MNDTKKAQGGDRKATRSKTNTTPRGIAIYPYFFTPQTKFSPEGIYTLRLKLAEEDAQQLIENIEAMVEAAYEEAKEGCRNPREIQKLKKAVDSYEEELDTDGNPTGYYLFRFKKRASGTRKDGTPWTSKLPIFDSRGQPVTTPIDVGSGSEVRIAYDLMPFYTPAVGYGCSCRLSAVQLIKVVSSGGYATDPTAYGFGAEDDGFDIMSLSEGEGTDAPFTTNAQQGGEEDF
jgi:hypothetical protein